MRVKNMAFTLMEILMVVIIISVIAGFGIPSYYKSYERGLRKNAESQLKSVQRAQELYKLKYDYYYPLSGNGDTTDTATLNADLNINIMASGFEFSCLDLGQDPSAKVYKCRAVRDNSDYVLEITESSSDISCTGSCP